MSLKGITFNGANVTAKNDGGLYQAHFTDGVLWGCAMSLSGSNLVVGSGQLLMAGRVVEFDGSTNISLSGHGLTTGYIQVILTAQGSSVTDSYVTSASTTFPALTQEDINFNGSVYQIELAIVRVTGGSLNSITTSLGFSGLVTEGGIASNGTNNFGGGLKVIQNSLPRIDISSISADNDARFRGLKADGTVSGGLDITPNGQSFVFGDGTIHFRPNGRTSTTGQVAIDTTGQIIGGHSLSDNITTGSISCTHGTDTVIKNVSTVSGGVYLITATCVFAPSASTTTQFRFSLSDGTVSYTNSVIGISTDSHMANVSGLFNGGNVVSFICRPYSTSVNCSCTNRRIMITRLA